MYVVHAGNDVYVKDKLSDVMWMSLIELHWADEVYVCNVDDALLLQLTYNVVTIGDKDINQIEAILYPALADAIVAEQNRLTDEDMQVLAAAVSGVLTLLLDRAWDSWAVDDLYRGLLEKTGEMTSHELDIRLLKVQKKLLNQGVTELGEERFVLM